MYMKIIVGGQEFRTTSKPIPEGKTIENVASKWRENFNQIANLSIELQNKDFLILGEKMLEKTIFIVVAEVADIKKPINPS